MTHFTAKVQRPGVYDGLTAWWLARLADLAYADTNEASHQTAAWGLDRFYFFDRCGSQCFLAGNRQYVVLSFRGTEPLKLMDWLSDARIKQRPGPFGASDRVHAGFDDYVDRVWPQVHKGLPPLVRERQSLWLTGHSLGAAAATITAARLAECGHHVAGVYTYGSPRVGNRAFAAIFDYVVRNCHRHRNNNDLVTRVPWCLGRYRHVGRKRLHHITYDGRCLLNPAWWTVLWDRWGGPRRSLLQWGTDGILDHSVAQYVRHLHPGRLNMARLQKARAH